MKEKCILCGAFEASREFYAITEGDTQMHIDVSICVEYGSCERNCPSGAIIYEEDNSSPG